MKFNSIRVGKRVLIVLSQGWSHFVHKCIKITTNFNDCMAYVNSKQFFVDSQVHSPNHVVEHRSSYFCHEAVCQINKIHKCECVCNKRCNILLFSQEIQCTLCQKSIMGISSRLIMLTFTSVCFSSSNSSTDRPYHPNADPLPALFQMIRQRRLKSQTREFTNLKHTGNASHKR